MKIEGTLAFGKQLKLTWNMLLTCMYLTQNLVIHGMPMVLLLKAAKVTDDYTSLLGSEFAMFM